MCNRYICRAMTALNQYEDADPRGAVIDLLTDLRHFCRKEGISFSRCLWLSKEHHRAEH